MVKCKMLGKCSICKGGGRSRSEPSAVCQAPCRRCTCPPALIPSLYSSKHMLREGQYVLVDLVDIAVRQGFYELHKLFSLCAPSPRQGSGAMVKCAGCSKGSYMSVDCCLMAQGCHGSALSAPFTVRRN